MSGATIAEEINAGGMPNVETTENLEGVHVDGGDDGSGGSRLDISFLKAKTGEGPIEGYIQHPLNFNESRPVARIIRGVTGLMGELDFALVDVMLGILEYMRGRQSVKAD